MGGYVFLAVKNVAIGTARGWAVPFLLYNLFLLYGLVWDDLSGGLSVLATGSDHHRDSWHSLAGRKIVRSEIRPEEGVRMALYLAGRDRGAIITGTNLPFLVFYVVKSEGRRYFGEE